MAPGALSEYDSLTAGGGFDASAVGRSKDGAVRRLSGLGTGFEWDTVGDAAAVPGVATVREGLIVIGNWV